MEPTDHNRRAFDEAHRTSENVLQVPGMPERIRERLQGAGGHRVLHLFSGTGRESVDLADLGALVTAVSGAGLELRGLEEWPGKDAHVPGHLVLAAEKPGA